MKCTVIQYNAIFCNVMCYSVAWYGKYYSVILHDVMQYDTTWYDIV